MEFSIDDVVILSDSSATLYSLQGWFLEDSGTTTFYMNVWFELTFPGKKLSPNKLQVSVTPSVT